MKAQNNLHSLKGKTRNDTMLSEKEKELAAKVVDIGHTGRNLNTKQLLDEINNKVNRMLNILERRVQVPDPNSFNDEDVKSYVEDTIDSFVSWRLPECKEKFGDTSEKRILADALRRLSGLASSTEPHAVSEATSWMRFMARAIDPDRTLKAMNKLNRPKVLNAFMLELHNMLTDDVIVQEDDGDAQ